MISSGTDMKDRYRQEVTQPTGPELVQGAKKNAVCEKYIKILWLSY